MFKLIIFLIILWQVRTVLKKVFEKATRSTLPENPSQKPSWQDKLKDAAEKIKTEMEAAQKRQKEAASPKPPEWEKIQPGKKKSPKSLKKEIKQKQLAGGTPSLSKKKETAISAKMSAQQEYLSPEEKSRKLADDSKKQQETHALQPKKRRERFKDICEVRNLTKAVVWSEILGPPLSMRDEKRPLKRVD